MTYEITIPLMIVLLFFIIYGITKLLVRLEVRFHRKKQKRKNRAMMQMRKEYYDYHRQVMDDEINGRAQDAMQQMRQHHEQECEH